MERQQQIALLIDYFQDADVGVAWQKQDGIAIIQSLPKSRSCPIAVETAKLAAERLTIIIVR